MDTQRTHLQGQQQTDAQGELLGYAEAMAPFTYKTKPLDHQRAHFEKHAREARFALLWEQGTGKTKEMIDELALMIAEKRIGCILLVAPNGVHRNWLTDEIPKHMPDEIRDRIHPFIYQSNKASTKWHKRALDRCVGIDGKLPMLIFSYDGFMTDAGKKAAWRLLQRGDCCYILDEAHHIKTPGAKKTKSILASSKYAPVRRIMTGTPIAVGPFDLYSQLKFIDEHIWDDIGCSTFAAYKTFFGVWEKGYNKKQGREFPILVRYRNLDILQKKLDKISTRVLKDDVLDLPPKLFTTRYYEMTRQQAEIYETLKSEFMYDHGNGKFTNASLAIVRLLRFQQVLCGYLPFEDELGNRGVEVIPGGNPRLDLLHECIEDLPHQAIIWARFTKDIDLILDRIKAMGKRAGRYDGQCGSDELERTKRGFNAGELDFFVGNQSMGSEGLTLNAGKSTIYYNNTFRYIHRRQSEDRNHRFGQDGAVHEFEALPDDPYAAFREPGEVQRTPSGPVRGVLYTDLIAQDTVDEHFVRNLLAKQALSDQITGDRVKEWLSI
jgi:hypothetical protein